MTRSEQILRDVSVDFGQSAANQMSSYAQAHNVVRLETSAAMRTPPYLTDRTIGLVRRLALLDVTIPKPGKPGIHGRRTEKFLRALIALATARTTAQTKKAEARVAKTRAALLAAMTPEVE